MALRICPKFGLEFPQKRERISERMAHRKELCQIKGKLTNDKVCFHEVLKPSRLDHYLAEVNLETQIHNCL
jgi:hypothetical protein